MKRRTFIKRTSIGLSALAIGAGAAGAGGIRPPGDGRRRVYGIPTSVLPRSPLEHNRARLALSMTEMPVETWQDVVALGLLAQDVFDNPAVAQSFSRNPAGYLRAVGMEDVALDPESTEVKVALALGDPEIRDALQRQDPQAFVRALEARGLLRNPEPSQLAERLNAQQDLLRASLVGPQPEFCIPAAAVCVVLAAVWVWVMVVQDVAAVVSITAAVSVFAIVVLYVRITGPKHKKPEGTEALVELPPFQLATALGGRDFGSKVADAFIDDNVARIAAAVESLEVYREAAPMSGDQLRGLVRTQMVRHLQGRMLSLGAPEP